jgi:hypothetical protein
MNGQLESTVLCTVVDDVWIGVNASDRRLNLRPGVDYVHLLYIGTKIACKTKRHEVLARARTIPPVDVNYGTHH